MTDEHDDDDDLSGDDTGDDDAKAKKRKERLEQNRISARESRKRKKTMIEELQRTVITLSRENKELNERNENLRRQLMEIGAKYPNIVPLQAIVSQASASANALGTETSHQPPASAPPTSGALSSLNPLNWLGGGGGGSAPSSGTGASANV